MKKSAFLLAIVLLLVTGTWLIGQEEEATEVAEKQLAEVTIPDAAENVVLDSQAAAATETPDTSFKSASEIIEEYMDKKGYETDISKGVIFQTAKAKMTLKDTSVTSNLLNQRSMLALRAYLKAKLEIVATIRSEMSGEQLVSMPGSPVANTLDQNEMALINDMPLLSEGILHLLGKDELLPQIECEALTSDALVQTVDAAMQKAPENVKNNSDYRKMVAVYQAQKGKYIDACHKAESGKKVLEEISNKAELLAKMPIYGVTVIKQTESISPDGEVEVAVLVCWSKKLNNAASRILQGADTTYAPDKKGRTVKQYLQSHKTLYSMMASRQFIDKDGKMWFIGIQPASTKGNDIVQEKNEVGAQTLARSYVVQALFAEAVLQQYCEQNWKRLGDGSNDENEELEDEFTNTVEREIRTKYSKIPLFGLRKIYDLKVAHPLYGGEKIYIAIYGINSGDISALKSIRDEMYKTGLAVNKALEFERGKNAQMNKRFEESKNDPAARAAGAASANQTLREPVKQAQPSNMQQLNIKGKTNNDNSGNKVSSGAVEVEDNDDNDDFF